MTGRSRAARRQAGSIEPLENQATRQNRRSTRRTQATEQKTRPQHEIAQRGTRRERRRSTEALATDDSLESSTDYAGTRSNRSSVGPASESAGPKHHASDSDTDGSDEPPEAKAARVQDMIDFDIPKLSRWNESMYSALRSMNGPPSSSSDRKRLASIRKAFDAARRPFAEDSQLCIDSFVLTEDYGLEVRAAVQKAICSGNIVSLLASIVDIKQGKGDSLHVFQQLDDAFPTLFGPSFQTDPGNMDKDTFKLAFSVRCCRLALSLAADPSLNPLIIAADIFCGQRRSRAHIAQEMLINGPFRKLAGTNVNENIEFHDAYRAQMGGLVSILSMDDKSEAVESLNREYPENVIVDYLWSWARDTFESFGSVEQKSSQARKQAEQTESSVERGEEDGLFVTGPDDSESDTDTEGFDQLVPQSSDVGFIDGSATLAAVKQIEREAEKGKQNVVATQDAIRGLDPRKVLGSSHPEHLQSSLSNPGGSRQPSFEPQPASTAGAMRTRQRSVEDGGASDDDFEVNEQLINESKRVRYQDTVQELHSKRPRVSSGSHRENSNASLPSGTTSRREIRKRLADGDPFVDDEDLRETDIMALSQAAQENRRSNNSYRPRQTRTPWSAADTERLLDLIADPSLNCSWASMERCGGFEKNQTQQSLRDKARNLKVLYLQSGTVLPAGFDQVALGTKERDAVIKSGRNPDRTESDLDEYGRVINDIWAAH
ncbi:hypothetical protein F5X96DRAFT_619178 [Biscogniauxia mediterranea]|nr:hypothetical protein F5X96DRAFT_619178 [Biscogniauxia mediterranea]